VGGEVHSRFPEPLKRDSEFGLLVAEKYWRLNNFSDAVSRDLRSDKKFMTKAVRINPLTFLDIEGGLDPALIAFSSPDTWELNER